MDKNGCWNWDGCVDTKGYGRYHAEGRKWLAHVYMYVATHGPVPEGFYLDHHCLNKRCVNPKHLCLATRSQNGAYRPKPVGVKRQFTSNYKGVAKVRNKWKAYICLGTFKTETEAAKAYDKAARQIFGQFAFANLA